MPMAYSDLINSVSQVLQDTGNSLWLDAELVLYLPESLTFISRFKPYITKVRFTVESRTGTATSTGTAFHLVDATNLQFLSTDVGKVVYNSTDKTWALITARTSTSDITLSKDIMTSGEAYEIYNEGCTNAKQINIEDVTDCMWVEELEFPVGTRRNPKDRQPLNNIVEIDMAAVPEDTAESSSDKDVYLWVAKPHRLSQLTDFAGAINHTGGYSEGDTSMILTDLQTGGGTIEEGQEFTVTNVRGTYWTTAAATISGTPGGATISFWPALESVVANSIVVTFRASTLTFELENILIDVWAGKASINKAPKLIQEANNAITLLTTTSTAIGLMSSRITQAIADTTFGRAETGKVAALILEANTALDKIDAEIGLAKSDLSTGLALINTITKDDAVGHYAQYANAEVNTGRGYLSEGIGYLNQAQADEALTNTYGGLAAREFNAAGQYLNQASGYMRQLTSGLSIAASNNHFVQWGNMKLAQAQQRLQQMARARKHTDWSRY